MFRQRSKEIQLIWGIDSLWSSPRFRGTQLKARKRQEWAAPEGLRWYRWLCQHREWCWVGTQPRFTGPEMTNNHREISDEGLTGETQAWTLACLWSPSVGIMQNRGWTHLLSGVMLVLGLEGVGALLECSYPLSLHPISLPSQTAMLQRSEMFPRWSICSSTILSKASLSSSTLPKWLLDLTRLADNHLLSNSGWILCSHCIQASSSLGPCSFSVHSTGLGFLLPWCWFPVSFADSPTSQGQSPQGSSLALFSCLLAPLSGWIHLTLAFNTIYMLAAPMCVWPLPWTPTYSNYLFSSPYQCSMGPSKSICSSKTFYCSCSPPHLTHLHSWYHTFLVAQPQTWDPIS